MAPERFELRVNGERRGVKVDPATPLLYVLRNDLGLRAVKFGCGLEQCGACTVIVGGEAVRSCTLPVSRVGEREVTTVEGLASGDDLHPLQRAFADEQAAQCAYCVPGVLMEAAALLAWNDDPSDAEVRRALADHVCRCGAQPRMLRAIRRAARPESVGPAPLETRRAAAVARAPHPLSPSLARNPDLDTWIRVEGDGGVTVFTGKVEIGQGIKTAIARIAAEELDLRLDQVRVHTADTAEGPDEFLTAGSMSVMQSGSAVRLAAAEARQVLLERAAERLGAPLQSLWVEEGVVRARGAERSLSYGELFAGRRFERKITGEATLKAPESYRILGRPGPRIDLLGKLTGAPFVHDLRPDGVLFGRVVRPPSLRAELVSVDLEAVRALPGVVEVVRDGAFLGVVAEREEQVIAAREQLRDGARWDVPPALPGDRDLVDWLLELPRDSYPVVDGTPEKRPVEPHVVPPEARTTLEARYARPFVMHAAIAPSAALARFDEGQLTVWTHCQGPTFTRAALANVTGLDAAAIRLIHVDGPGCYGHNGADDAALDATLLACAVPGRPVLLQWMRDDEHCWEPYGPAMVIEVSGSLDAAGGVVDWSHDTYSLTHLGRPRPGEQGSRFIAAWHLAEPFERPPPEPRLGREVGIHRNAPPYYAFPRTRVVKHLLKTDAFRTSSFRGLGAFANVFAIESFMDELARAAGTDPLEFRLRHLKDPRARAVLEAAAERAGWPGPAGAGRALGLSFARYESIKTYAAVAVDLELNEQSGAIRLHRAVIAADAGQIVDPEGLANQLEGGFVQAASMTLLEEVRFDSARITSQDWDSYPILGFADVPEIETVLLDRPGAPFLGAGEACTGPTPAAIGNALYRASGRRLRRTPFTPERVLATPPG